MIGLLITGHGHFATGLSSSLQLVTGISDHIAYVDFEADHSTETLTENLSKGLDTLKDCDGVLVLSDLAGGSPFKAAVECKYARPDQKIEVVAGSSLPMLITAATLIEMYDDPVDMAEEVMNTGKEYIVRYEMEEHVDDAEEDGI